MNDHNKKLLNSIYQNIRIGVQSIDTLLTKLKDNQMTEELSRENDKYLIYEKEVSLLANAVDHNLKDTNIIQKAQIWTSIQMNMISNCSIQHIAQMMLIGTNMGVIDLVKAVTIYDQADSETFELANKVEHFERDNIEKLFEFLKVKPTLQATDENLKEQEILAKKNDPKKNK